MEWVSLMFLTTITYIKDCNFSNDRDIITCQRFHKTTTTRKGLDSVSFEKQL